MKTKLLSLSLLVALLFGVSPQAKADVTTLKESDGWVKLTAMPSDDWGSYYYVIADWKQNLMLQLGRGANQDKNYNGVWYQSPKDPLEDQTVLWTMEKNVKSDGTITYNLWRSVAFPDYFLQTESDKLYFFHTHDNGGGDKVWGRTIFKYNASGYFYIKNKNNETYLGAWDDAANPDAMTAGSETAINKTSSKQGHFVVYAIKKTDYDNLKQARFNAATKETPQNVSWLINDPNMSLSASNSRWTVGSGKLSIDGLATNRCAEFFNCKFDMYQEFSDVPNGVYELKMQGFYRQSDGANDANAAAAARENGTEIINAYLYANNQTQAFPSIFDNNCTVSPGSDYVTSTSPSINGVVHYVPNSMVRAAKWFSDGAYETSIKVTVTDGTLKIGVKKTVENSQDWTIFDNFRLYYYGPAEDPLAAVKEQAIAKLDEYAIDDNIQNMYDTAKAAIENATDETEVANILAQFDEDYKYGASAAVPTSAAIDLTSVLMKNADFASGATGWNASNKKGEAVSSEPWTPYSCGNAITKTPSVIESYSGWSAHNTDQFSLTQQVLLSAGKYRLRAYAFQTSGSNTAKLVAGDNKIDVYRRSAFENIADRIPYNTPNDKHEASEAFGAGNYLNELIFDVAEQGAFTVGFEGTFSAKQQWFVCGPVTLEKISDSVLAAEANAELEAIKAVYEARKTAYTAIATQQTKAGVTFDVTSADAAKTSASTKAEVESAILALGTALTDYMNEFSEDFNLTSLIKNPSFETANPLDWYCITEGDNDAKTHGIGAVGGTYYTDGFDGSRLFNTYITSATTPYEHYVFQRIDYLPMGEYRLSALFAGDQADAALRLTANDNTSGYISCSDAAVAVPAEVTFYNSTAGRVRIGAKSDRWFKCDNFQLFYHPVNISDWMAVDLGNINLENDGVQAFLSEADYTSQGATSVVSNYTSQGNDRPNAVVIYVPKTQGTPSTLTLHVSDKDDYSGTDTNTRTISLAPGTMRYDLYNTTPGYTYYYNVKADGKIITQGTFTTEGTVRMIYAEGGSNMRDLGGRITTEGKKVRYGRLYRGGEMHLGKETNLTSAGIAEMERLGIKAELDLRQLADISTGVAPTTSALTGADYIFEDLAHFSTDAFSNDEDRARLKSAFEFVAESMRNNKPVYFHCIWGADRTGMMAMLLGATLGFSLDDLTKDYELTSFSKAGLRDKPGMDGKITYVQANNQGNTIQEQLVDFLINTCAVSQDDLDAIRAYMLEDDADAMATHVKALKAEYQKVIDAANATWNTNGITTEEALNAEYNRAMNALTDEIDLTSLLTNADFTNGTTGWTTRETVAVDGNGKSAEFFQSAASVRQALNNMPAGTYIIKVQGYQRTGDPADSYAAYAGGTDEVASYMFANDAKLTLHNIFDDASNTQVRTGDSDPARGVYVPNTLNGAGQYYDLNLYWNVLRIKLTDVQNIVLGVATTVNNTKSWTCFDNFKLYYRSNSYVGDATLTLNDGQAVTIPTEDTYYTVAGNRTLKPNCWNTLCIPFDMDADAMAAAHMTDVRTLGSIDVTDDHYAITFTPVSEIKAGMPYLVRVSEEWNVAGSDILVRAKQPVKVMKESGAFEGYYSPAMQVSDIYYIGGNDANGNYFYHATKPTNLRGMRAHISLAAPAAAAGRNFTIGLADEVEADPWTPVGIESIDAEKDNTIYDLTGRKVSNITKGLYIVNGKKVMVK